MLVKEYYECFIADKMDLRSNATIARKQTEALAERELAGREREMARIAKQEAAIKQQKEVNMDRKAYKADQHGEELRGHRDTAL